MNTIIASKLRNDLDTHVLQWKIAPSYVSSLVNRDDLRRLHQVTGGASAESGMGVPFDPVIRSVPMTVPTHCVNARLRFKKECLSKREGSSVPIQGKSESEEGFE
jgi:hypothetical protein